MNKNFVGKRDALKICSAQNLLGGKCAQKQGCMAMFWLVLIEKNLAMKNDLYSWSNVTTNAHKEGESFYSVCLGAEGLEVQVTRHLH